MEALGRGRGDKDAVGDVADTVLLEPGTGPASVDRLDFEELAQPLDDAKNRGWSMMFPFKGKFSLDHPVDDARHAELSDPAVRLGDFNPLDRLRLVGSLEQLRPNVISRRR